MDSNYFEVLFDDLCYQLKEHDNLNQVSKEFMARTTDLDRIRFLLQLDVIEKVLQLPVNYASATSEKSSEKSSRLRDEGNKLFKNKKYSDSVKAYTNSLSWAPLPTPASSDYSASLALANRSASLFQLREYELCLDNISLALRIGYPKELQYKLYDRQGQCELELGHIDNAIVSFSEAKKCLVDSGLNETRRQQLSAEISQRLEACATGHVTSDNSNHAYSLECNKKVPQLLRGPSKDFSSLSVACHVEYAPDRGRFIVANCDIFPGDVILVEKPYASVLLSENRLDHCDHCYKPAISLIACNTCHHALYCGDKCRQDALSSYHRTECALRSALIQSGVDKFALLAVRTVIVSSLSGDPGSISGINTLVTHSDQRAAHDLFRRSAIAIFLTRCLQFAGFFDTQNPSLDALAATSGLLLTYLQSFPCNAHEISEFDLLTNAVANSVPHELGAGIYAALSLFNHSCNPAVTRNFYGETCVVRAIRTIRSGEELSDNYGAVYAIQSLEDRRNKLKPQYYFECCCTACMNDWPLFTSSQTGSPTWRCRSCQSACVSQCTQCGQATDVASNMKQLAESNSAYSKAFDALLRCDINDACLGDMLSHLRVMDQLICLPWQDYCACQEAVKQCFSIMANCRIVCL